MDPLGGQELEEQLAFLQQQHPIDVQNANCGFIFDENATSNLAMMAQNGCPIIDQNGENKNNFAER